MELFDLSKDISERRNLATEMPERTAAMSRSLTAMEESIGNLREKGRRELQRRLEGKQKRKNQPDTAAKTTDNSE